MKIPAFIDITFRALLFTAALVIFGIYVIGLSICCAAVWWWEHVKLKRSQSQCSNL